MIAAPRNAARVLFAGVLLLFVLPLTARPAAAERVAHLVTGSVADLTTRVRAEGAPGAARSRHGDRDRHGGLLR